LIIKLVGKRANFKPERGVYKYVGRRGINKRVKG
jgi:hypothetical protein